MTYIRPLPTTNRNSPLTTPFKTQAHACFTVSLMEATITTTNLSAPLASPLASAPDCDRVNIVLDQLLEGRSLTEEDEDYLLSHGEDCSPCFDNMERQKAFVSFLNQKVVRRRAPQSLPQAIMARLHAELA